VEDGVLDEVKGRQRCASRLIIVRAIHVFSDALREVSESLVNEVVRVVDMLRSRAASRHDRGE